METETEYVVETESLILIPAPRPRKRAVLWQTYQFWDELVEWRKRHTLRLSAIERGVSNMDAPTERAFMDALNIDAQIAQAKKLLVGQAEISCGSVWDWITSIKGLGAGPLAAQLLAQIDDIGSFDTVSKLWRFCGYAVIGGRAEKNTEGEKSHYNAKLKSICYLIAEQFIRQQTPVYTDIYYSEKARQRAMYPVPMCRICGVPWTECQSKKTHKQLFNDAHIHNRAWRKMVKIFLQNLWLVWRRAEGLPVSEPFAARLGHTHFVLPEEARGGM